MPARKPKAENIVWQSQDVDRAQREAVLGQRGKLVWLTGLSGSGKSTIAGRLEAYLNSQGRAVYLLDGDNVRYGLSDDLGFAPQDRSEHIRRVGEVGRLFVDAGLITVAAFISPYRSQREHVRTRMDPGDFVEVFVSTPLEVCESRDPKGLYRRARTGEICSFTGISAPYEPPASPDITIDTTTVSVADAVGIIADYLLRED